MKKAHFKPCIPWLVSGVVGTLIGTVGLLYYVKSKPSSSRRSSRPSHSLKRLILTEENGYFTFETIEKVHKIWAKSCIPEYLDLLAKHRENRRHCIHDIEKYAEYCFEFLSSYDQIIAKKGKEMFEKLKMDMQKWAESCDYHEKNDGASFILRKLMKNIIKYSNNDKKELSLDACKTTLCELIELWKTLDIDKFREIYQKNPHRPILIVIESLLFDTIYQKYEYEEEEFFNPDWHTKYDDEMNKLYIEYYSLQGKVISKLSASKIE